MPGGFGTLDELFEIVTWNQLAIHDKKVFVLNTAGFYNRLLDHLKFLENEEFLRSPLSEQFTLLNEPEEIEQHIRS